MADVARISSTGLLREAVGGSVADAVDHDLSGRLMMPRALLLLWAELQLPSRLRIARPRPGA